MNILAQLVERRYDPDQPRVPAGHGQESGRWTAVEPGSVQGPSSGKLRVPGHRSVRAGRRLSTTFAVSLDQLDPGAATFDLRVEHYEGAHGLEPKPSEWIEPPKLEYRDMGLPPSGLGKLGEYLLSRWGGSFRGVLSDEHHQGPFDLQYDHSDLMIELKSVNLAAKTASGRRPQFAWTHVRNSGRKHKDAVVGAARLKIRYGTVAIDPINKVAYLYLVKPEALKKGVDFRRQINRRDFECYGWMRFDLTKALREIGYSRGKGRKGKS